MAISEWIDRVAIRFRRAGLHFGHGTTSAETEAAWIAARVCRIFPRNIETYLDRPLSMGERARADLIAEMRIRERKPLAYLLKEAWLARNRFYVDERVIVPRSHLAEITATGLRPWVASPANVKRGLDLCTGSACLAILLAKSFPSARIDAADLSSDALAVARINVVRYKLQKRLRLFESDLFEKISSRVRYDIILSNPPYVNNLAMKALPIEYGHEPRLALSGGTDGLRLLLRIIQSARKFLAPGGLLVLEVGHNKRALESALPRMPLIWLDTPGAPDMVALIEAAHLPK